MTTARTKTTTLRPVGRLRHDLEVIVGRLRHDVQGFMARSREEVLNDIGDLERRMLLVLHGATREQVGRLERRIARLEQTVTRLRRSADGPGVTQVHDADAAC